MKRSAFLSVWVCLLLTNVRADEPTGIQFFSGSWQELLTEAKRQNKTIFVDFYTTWCPPCRRMAKEAFPNALVGAKFNQHFMSYQLDAELGEGFTLARRYSVESYPTALYILHTGELVHRGVGYGGINAMLKQADMVLSMPSVRRSQRKHKPGNDLATPALKSQTDSVKMPEFRN